MREACNAVECLEMIKIGRFSLSPRVRIAFIAIKWSVLGREWARPARSFLSFLKSPREPGVFIPAARNSTKNAPENTCWLPSVVYRFGGKLPCISPIVIHPRRHGFYVNFYRLFINAYVTPETGFARGERCLGLFSLMFGDLWRD